MRKLIVKIHIYIGILVSVPILISIISGGVYLWQPELSRVFYPKLNVSHSNIVNPIEPLVLVDLIYKEENSTIERFFFPERERDNYCIKLVGESYYRFYDVNTGAYLGKTEYKRGVLDIILKIHMFSYIKNGGTFIGVVALLCLFLVIITGIILWFPRKRKLKRIDFYIPKKQFKIPIVYYLLHKQLGLFFSLIIITVLFSGAFYSFKNQYVNLFSFINIEEFNSSANNNMDYSLATTPKNNDANFTIYNGMDVILNNYKEFKPRSIILPKDNDGRVYISWMQGKGMDAGKRMRPFVYINPSNHEVYFHYHPSKSPKHLQWAYSWMAPLHFGEWGGYITRILYSVMLFAFVLIVFTGLRTYVKKISF